VTVKNTEVKRVIEEENIQGQIVRCGGGARGFVSHIAASPKSH
jgi:hypothetical protein